MLLYQDGWRSRYTGGPALEGGTVKAAVVSQRDQIRSMLADLKLPGALEAVDRILSDVDGGTLTASEAIAAAQHGRRVYYGTLVDLITPLEEAQAAGS